MYPSFRLIIYIDLDCKMDVKIRSHAVISNINYVALINLSLAGQNNFIGVGLISHNY